MLPQQLLPVLPFLSLCDIFPRPGEVFARRQRSSSLLFESSRSHPQQLLTVFRAERSLLVDIPTGWEPRTEQQPTGLIAHPTLWVGPYELHLLIFPQPLGRALKNQNAAPTTPPCFCRRQRSSSLLFESSRSHKKRKAQAQCAWAFLGATGRIRTSGLPGRSRTLYPAELRSHEG